MASTDLLFHMVTVQGIEQYVACNGAWQQNVSCVWCINLAKKRGGDQVQPDGNDVLFCFKDPIGNSGHNCSGHDNFQFIAGSK
jgi:hypothetical protein